MQEISLQDFVMREFVCEIFTENQFYLLAKHQQTLINKN